MRIIAAVALLSVQAGCASHTIRAAHFDPVGNAGQAFRHVSVSIAGRQGLSSEGTGYVSREECREGDLVQVEVRRNVGQAAVTLLTLGIVSPATILFHCEAPEIPPPCNCEQSQD
jgi:hypothetical protein